MQYRVTRNHKCSHLYALINKNWLYYKRQYVISIIEICVPILLMFIMLITRKETSVITYPEQTYESIFLMLKNMQISDSTYIFYPLTYDPIYYAHARTERI